MTDAVHIFALYLDTLELDAGKKLAPRLTDAVQIFALYLDALELDASKKISATVEAAHATLD